MIGLGMRGSSPPSARSKGLRCVLGSRKSSLLRLGNGIESSGMSSSGHAVCLPVIRSHEPRTSPPPARPIPRDSPRAIISACRADLSGLGDDIRSVRLDPVGVAIRGKVHLHGGSDAFHHVLERDLRIRQKHMRQYFGDRRHDYVAVITVDYRTHQNGVRYGVDRVALLLCRRPELSAHAFFPPFGFVLDLAAIAANCSFDFSPVSCCAVLA